MTSENKPKPGRVILRIAILLVIIAGIFLVVLFAFEGDKITSFKWDQLDPIKLIESLKQEHSEVTAGSFKFTDLNVSGTGVYMGNLLLLTESDVRLINSKGEELWYYTHEIRQPDFVINGNMALIYERNGKSYMVIRNGKVQLRGKLDEEIAYGEMSENQLLFITVSETGYKRTIYSVSPENGVRIGALYIDDYYPYCAKTTDEKENEYFILYGLGMNSNSLSTIIRLYGNTLSPSPDTNIELKGLYPVMYQSGGKRLFSGDKGAFCYNRVFDLIWSKEFDTDLLAAGLFENGGTVLGFEGKLIFCDNQGNEFKTISMDKKISNIEVFNNTAAVVTGTEAVFYDSSGNQIGDFSMPGMSLKVHFVDGNKAFLVSEHEAVFHTISGKQ